MAIRIESKITGFSVARKDAESASSTPAPHAAPAASEQKDANTSGTEQRLTLPESTGVAERSLRWPKRPASPGGFEAWASDWIRAPRTRFALCVSHYRNGVLHPFEVWVLGGETPREASMICEILSKVMQTNEPGFIAYYLDALAKAQGEPFEVTLPHSGETVRAGSIGAAIARIVKDHASHIGFLTPDRINAPSPMLQAMTSLREPKTSGNGGVAFYEDIRNTTNGDDFPVFLKEGVVNGRVVPFSAWAGNNGPRESESILKLVSLAMRHADPKWAAMILRILATSEFKGEEFWGGLPGSEKSRYYGSTWALVAEFILARYRKLGILDHENNPVTQAGLFAEPVATPVATAEPKAATGRYCTACGEHAVRRIDGCDTCMSCSASKCS